MAMDKQVLRLDCIRHFTLGSATLTTDSEGSPDNELRLDSQLL